METLTTFYETYIDTTLLLLIILSGLFITKYTRGVLLNIGDRYKVLIASILFSTALYFSNDCRYGCLTKYLITYLFATSFYELIAAWLVKLVKAKFKSEG